jgi:predicted metalloendopeptidase
VKNWWTKDDYTKFKSRIQVIDRYSTFTVLDSLHVKGDMTVGENTADIAGIAVAYDFKMTKQGQDTIKLAVIHQTNVSIFCCPHMESKMKENFFVCGLITTPFTTYLALMDH